MAGHEFTDHVGEAKQALLQLGPVEGEKDVEQVLGRLDEAEGQVGLQEVEAGGRTVAAGIIVGRHQLDEFAHVAA